MAEKYNIIFDTDRGEMTLGRVDFVPADLHGSAFICGSAYEADHTTAALRYFFKPGRARDGSVIKGIRWVKELPKAEEVEE